MIEVIISSTVSLILGIGSTLLFYPQSKKEKNIQNESKQSDEWRKLYEEQSEELKGERKRHEDHIIAKDQKIDSLYCEISRHRDEKAEKSNRIAELEVDNTRLCLLKCEVPNCPNRKPPTGY